MKTIALLVAWFALCALTCLGVSQRGQILPFDIHGRVSGSPIRRHVLYQTFCES